MADCSIPEIANAVRGVERQMEAWTQTLREMLFNVVVAPPQRCRRTDPIISPRTAPMR